MVNVKLADESYKLSLDFAQNEPKAPKILYVAKNDRVAFQLILQSDSRYSVNVGGCEWVSAGKHSASFEKVRVAVNGPFDTTVNHIGLVTDDDKIQKADVILNNDVCEYTKNIPSALWVETVVPRDAKAGDYSVDVDVFVSTNGADEQKLTTLSVPLTVLDYTMDDMKDSEFYLDLWQHNSNIARKYDVKIWSDEHFAVIEPIVKALSELGQKSITIIASQIPWFGQDCTDEREFGGNLFEYSCIPITKKADGSFVYDYSIMQRYIDLCRSYGISGDIEVFGLVNVWGKPSANKKFPIEVEGYPETTIKLRYFDEESGTFKYIRNGEQVKDYIRSLYNYFVKTNQLSSVRIAADEPSDIEKYRESMAMIKELCPDARCACAINHAEFIEEFSDVIDCFVPYLRCTIKEYDRLIEYKNTLKDKRFMWYVCCGHATPNTFIKSAPIEARAIGLTTSYLKLDGFLRWAFNIWPDNPRSEMRFSAFECGDAHFIYPAMNGTILYTLRYKNLQRGIGDYELINKVEKKYGREKVDELLSKLYILDDVHNYYNFEGEKIKTCKTAEQVYSVDWNDWNELKAEMISLIK